MMTESKPYDPIDEFGRLLDRLRHRIDARLARARVALDATKRAPVAPESIVTPDAVAALLRTLPRAVLGSLSGDPARVAKANVELAEVEARLGAAGIDLGGRLGDFPARLARLRRDFDDTRRPRAK